MVPSAMEQPPIARQDGGPFWVMLFCSYNSMREVEFP
jgi:hypothetical protein